MRGMIFIGLMGLAACSNTTVDRAHVAPPPHAAATATATASNSPAQPVATPVAHLPADADHNGPFEGVWQACDPGGSPDECSRYVLLQRGDRICGTWSYVATGDGYEGRLIAHMLSPTKAQRTQVCGRPGSETKTECEAGWDSVDKPLQLCSGKLGDMTAQDGSCHAGFVHAEKADGELAEVAAQPWVEACLAGTSPGAAK